PPAGGGGPGAQAAAEIKPLWIVNAVAARGSLATVLQLAARDDVKVVRLDKQIKLGESEISSEARAPQNLDLLPPAQARPGRGTEEQASRDQLIPLPQAPAWGVAKIRADLVHNALNIDGSGVVVANIDTGVDWQHPVLQSRYRGYTGAGKLPLHTGNWYDATGEGSTYPVDGNGHGTHTMGTMVGANGIGVAPGALWIAIRTFNSQGVAQNSWLHQAFQWALAPNGDPALAPDVVNNSWGSNIGSSTEFSADVQALLSAGIFPVFSAGNNGPGAGTVGSPGSLNLAFAVGATTVDDEIAGFSSRGPSPWGQVKPEVSAPGKDVLSTLPGGAYDTLSGTSMAAPHASGLAALLLQASPALADNPANIAQIMESTAAALGSPIPNNDYGWGRIDAYNAVMSVAGVGALQGTVTQGAGSPINGAAIQITAHDGGPAINTSSDAAGAYVQGLAANTYDAAASAFGYVPTTAFGLQIVTGTATTQNFVLTAKPTGILSGIVREAGSGAPLVAAIQVDGTPAGATSAADGTYSLTLPTGTYSLTVVAARHRLAKAVDITINDGATVGQDFWLDPAPGILLVDSGRWYQESEIGYYQQALTELLYPYDTWQIDSPFDTPTDIPTAATLANYDLVIWSSPLDSPGYIGADDELVDFLNGGGKLLLSGQDVAYHDGGGSIFSTASYLRNYLKAAYVQDNSGLEAVAGQGPLEGLSLTIAGGDGADNQTSPDVIANVDSDFAGSLLAYGDGGLAGLHIGRCVPYRALFLAFGYEGINSSGDRALVMARALDWLLDSPAEVELELNPLSDTVISNFGTVASHTVRIRNTGALTDTIGLTYSSTWPVNPAPPANLTLTSCQSQVITIGVTVDTTTWHISDTLTLTAQSTVSSALTATATRTSQSPAPVLLVDDDRWYSFAAEYRAALEANDIPYDYWLVPKSWSGPVPPSPPLSTLQMYPMTVWYTAYDWFQPLTAVEEERLAAYLAGGGRLLFSGQDYIYNLPDHKPSQFTQDYLGVLAHTEDYSSTLVVGEAGNIVGTYLGPYPLTFPPGYNNWTDALTPTATAQVATRGQAGQPNGVTHAGFGPGGEAWQTLFLAYGPELLDSSSRARLMQRGLGWLSWLGRSTVEPGVAAALDGAAILYTATITNDGWDNLATAYFTATLPAGLTWDTYSADLAPDGGDLAWSG
ncbi:MAG: S8 family serine peptidase, partial [Chloroflexota bacterium]